MVSVDGRRAPAGGTVIQRRKPLPRSRKRLARRTRPQSKGKSRFKVSGKADREYRTWIRRQVCAIPATDTWMPNFSLGAVMHVCHVRSRGAGGTDRANLVPMCATHHAEQHIMGIRTFEKRHSVNLKQMAAEYQVRYQAWRAAQAGAR